MKQYTFGAKNTAFSITASNFNCSISFPTLNSGNGLSIYRTICIRVIRDIRLLRLKLPPLLKIDVIVVRGVG
jgi:hypothetical protein